MKKENLIFLSIGIFIGALASANYVDSAVPPTPAIEGTIVHTEDWAGQSTLVKAGSYNDKVHFISDGSIIFNVTQSP